MTFNLKKINRLTVIIILGLALLLPQITLAQSKPADGFYGLDQTAENAGITVPEGNASAEANLQFMVGRIINYLFGLVGVIALTVVLVGGYLWMTGLGNEEKIGKAKKLIINGINGLIVMFLAYALVYVILFALENATK